MAPLQTELNRLGLLFSLAASLNHIVQPLLSILPSVSWFVLFQRNSEEYTPTRELTLMQFARKAVEPAVQVAREASPGSVGLGRMRGVSFHAGVG